MTVKKRGALARLEAAFSGVKIRLWDVVVPYAVISLAVSFVQMVAVPLLLPEGIASIVVFFLIIFSLLLSAALAVGAYFEIANPRESVGTSFSMDAVTWFFDTSWRELRKYLRTFYYAFEYVFLIPLLVGLALLAFFVLTTAGVGFANLPMAFASSWSAASVIFWLSIFVLFVFVLYRQLKAVFALVHAVVERRSDREAFKQSVALSDGKWWSIFVNFLVVGLVFMGITLIFALAVGIVLEMLPFPKSVDEFVIGLPATVFSVFIAFFTYELYKDFVPAEKKVDDIFVP